MQKLYYWVRKSTSNPDTSLFYDLKLKLNFDYKKAFTTKELEKIGEDTFLMEPTAIEHLVTALLLNLRVYNSKKTLALLHFIIKKLKLESSAIIYSKMGHYDWDQFFMPKTKYKSEEERNFYLFIKNYWKYLLSISFYTNIYKEDTFDREQELHKHLTSPKGQTPEKIQISESKISQKQKDRLELLSQGIFALIQVIEGISKLRSLSKNASDIG